MIQIANAPCSWGILEFDLGGQQGFAQVLDEMQQTGYAGTELGDWGFLPTEPTRLKAELEKRSLDLVGAFVPVALSKQVNHQAGVESALKIAKLMADAGFEDAFIVLADDNGQVPQRTKNAGRIRSTDGLSESEWQFFAHGADRIAREIKSNYHMRTVFHHHSGGYVETAAEVDKLMALTDPALLGLCLDMGHCSFGNGDPLSALKTYQDRIWHVHFKDCDPEIAGLSRQNEWDYFESVGQGLFCELGKGDVDFPAIVAELRKQQYHGWIVVEQDVLPGMGSPKQCAQRNRDYLVSLDL
ncbi:TIM barrel protein [candidate division KSB1 bacterium]|nr:TIM barrel protein [candidate division KSB1 bacterium]